jgi:hypothetical protein
LNNDWVYFLSLLQDKIVLNDSLCRDDLPFFG